MSPNAQTTQRKRRRHQDGRKESPSAYRHERTARDLALFVRSQSGAHPRVRFGRPERAAAAQPQVRRPARRAHGRLRRVVRHRRAGLFPQRPRPLCAPLQAQRHVAAQRDKRPDDPEPRRGRSRGHRPARALPAGGRPLYAGRCRQVQPPRHAHGQPDRPHGRRDLRPDGVHALRRRLAALRSRPDRTEGGRRGLPAPHVHGARLGDRRRGVAAAGGEFPRHAARRGGAAEGDRRGPSALARRQLRRGVPLAGHVPPSGSARAPAGLHRG